MGADRQEDRQVHPSRFIRRAWRRVAAVVLAAGVALGGAVAQTATADPKAIVEIGLPVGPVDGTSWLVGSTGLAVETSDDKWFAAEDGSSWHEVEFPGSRKYLVEGADGKGYLAYNGDDGERGWISLVKGARQQRVVRPDTESEPVFQASGYAYVLRSSTDDVYFQPFAGDPILLYAPVGNERVDDLSHVDSCKISWTLREQIPREEAGASGTERFKTHIYDTCAMKSVFAADEELDVVSVFDGDVAYRRHDDDDTDAVCLRRPGGGEDDCLWLSEDDWGLLAGPGLLLWKDYVGGIDNWEYRSFANGREWEITGECRVSENVRIVCTDDSGVIYRVSLSGKKTKIGMMPVAPLPSVPTISGGDLILTTTADIASYRISADGKSLGKPRPLWIPGRVTAVLGSGSRLLANTTLVDGEKVVTHDLFGWYDRALALSGPYYALETERGDRLVKHMDGREMLRTSDRIGGLFGSRVLTSTWETVKVVDLESGKTIATRALDAFVLGMWGDVAYFMDYANAGGTKHTLYAWNYVTGTLTTKHFTGLSDEGQVTDGVVLSGDRLINPKDWTSRWVGSVAPADRASSWIDSVASVENNRLAYTPYDKRSVVRVETLEFGGKSAPRMLGVLAKTSLKLGEKWKADIDFTKPLVKGTLEIRDAKKRLVRSITLPATADGSYRGITWDGKDKKGRRVAAGTYTWTVNAKDDPKRTGLKKGQTAKALDGKSAASGKIKILKKLTSTPTPKISGTTKVGKKLTVKPGSWKPAKVTLSYQWLRDGSKIKGATKSTYKLTKADKGKKITVKVTGKKSGYTSVTKTSKSTAKVK